MMLGSFNTIKSQMKMGFNGVVLFFQSTTIESSQIGDSRPLSYCSFSPNGKMLATASWYVCLLRAW